jgi:XTP/dITP diphosphohydrolase
MNLQELIFATSNQHKAREIQSLLPVGYRILTLKEAGLDIDIPEPFSTIEENSLHKAATIYRLTGKNCFAEDTGLEVEQLKGAPGVKSARFAGEPPNDQKNITKLLSELERCTNRNARFKTVITLIINGQEHQFTGICEGVIGYEPIGSNGFGYDPVFLPHPSILTFAQMELAEKNQFSHRKKALSSMIQFLNQLHSDCKESIE